jgi:T-complex protein 1 subunit gamma
LEVIPKTLATNCGMDVVRIITELRAKHAEVGNSNFGIDGNNKKISDMNDINVWEPIAVKNQVIKTSIEASCLLLRIDDVVSGVKRKENEKKGGPAPGQTPEAM